LFSVLIAMLDSVESLHQQYKVVFHFLELGFTILFTIEYVLRIYATPKPTGYIFSFWGFIDLFSILPTYLSLILYGYQYLIIMRIFRLLRVFRIFK
jgi:voltage-gated potassium channel